MGDEKKSLYLESTIPSYVAAKESKDVIKAARQTMTKLFWKKQMQLTDLRMYIKIC